MPCALGVLGDARLVLAGADRRGAEAGRRRARAIPRRWRARSREVHAPWLERWLPKLEADGAPLNPYRVLWELQRTVDVANTIITHDAGSPRDQLSPFWKSTTPLSYIGWGKSTQLGYGLGLAMGAKLAKPEKLCINVWGDAAIGFTGMDFETAVRERIPILSILLNNFCMAIELKVMPVSTERFRSTDISGDYAGLRPRAGRLWRAGRAARRHRARDPARHRGHRARPAGTARVHHHQGGRGLAAGLSRIL